MSLTLYLLMALPVGEVNHAPVNQAVYRPAQKAPTVQLTASLRASRGGRCYTGGCRTYTSRRSCGTVYASRPASHCYQGGCYQPVYHSGGYHAAGCSTGGCYSGGYGHAGYVGGCGPAGCYNGSAQPVYRGGYGAPVETAIPQPPPGESSPSDQNAPPPPQ